MIWRAIWTLSILLVGLLAIGAQLDRQSRYSPEFAQLVPGPFQSFAARHLVSEQLLADNGEQALQAARTLVRVRPVPAEHLTLLAQANAMAGHDEAALAALSAATRRGWREPVAQQAAAAAALGEGNAVGAAQRIAALLATGALPEQAQAQLAQLLVSPEGREVFASMLAEESRWRANALSQAANATDPSDLAEMLEKAQAANAELDCVSLERIAQRYESEGNADIAARFWPGNCR